MNVGVPGKFGILLGRVGIPSRPACSPGPCRSDTGRSWLRARRARRPIAADRRSPRRLPGPGRSAGSEDFRAALAAPPGSSRPSWLILVHRAREREEALRAVAARDQRGGQVERIADIVTKFPADLTGLHIGVDQRVHCGLVKFPAMRAGQRAIFDQLHLRVRVPHEESAFRRRETVWVQSPPAGGAIGVRFTGALLAAFSCLELQPKARPRRQEDEKMRRLHRFTCSG